MARPGSLGRHSAKIPQHSGCPSQTGLEPSISGWQLRAWQKGGEDIAYGWKGKGSTVHLVTEGNGLPLAFLVTAANVSEVTIGLEVVDRVKVPRPQGRPRQRPGSLAADKSYGSADFRWELHRRGIQSSISRRRWSPNDEIAKSEGRGQHRGKLARHLPCCHTCFSRISCNSHYLISQTTSD